MELRVLLFATFVVSVVSSPIPSKHSQLDYEYNNKTDAFYKLHTEPARNGDAIKICSEEGAELAKITSDEDLMQVQEMKVKILDKKERVFIGTGVYKGRGSQNIDEYNVVDHNGEIDTESNDYNRPFVCKVAAKDASAYNAECGVYSNDYEISSTGSCYRVSTVDATWSEAHAICQAEGAHLVILNSAEELEVLYNMLKDKPHDSETQYYAGVTADTTSETRVFKTVFNLTLEEVGYGPWDENEPNDYEGGENCVALDTRRHGKYNDVPCFNRMPYVCESSGPSLEVPAPSSTPDSVPADLVSSPLPPKQYRPGFEYNEKTDTFYKLYTKSRGYPVLHPLMGAVKTCNEEGAKVLQITSDEDLKQVQALKKKYLDLEARVMVAPKGYKGEDVRRDEKCNVVDRNGEIDTNTDCDHSPFVCTVAAKDAPAYNAECGVYSNDYQSRISTTGSCYRLSTEVATWDDAQEICEAEGAHLVILNSDKELEVLYNMLKGKPHEIYGENYAAGVRADSGTKPRVFKTVLNQTLEEVGYGPWEEGEPDNFQDYRGSQDCVVLDISRHGKYNDVFCFDYGLYVCEISVATGPVPPSTPSSDIKQVNDPVSSPAPPKHYRPGYEYNENTEAFYKLHTEGTHESDAVWRCGEEGAKLLNITSDEDLKQVQPMMKKLSNLEDYVMVESDEYNKCNVVNRNGKMETMTCRQQLPFVCKVAARDAWYDEECGVYSNDYKSRISSTGSCYRVSRVLATWNEALANCQADGAQLVVLNSDKELEVLYNILQDEPQNSETQYFAGVRADRTSEPRVFRTVLNKTLEEVGYGPWDENEPNNRRGGENCVALDIRHQGKYNDVWCNVRMPYICESTVVVPSEISEPPSTPSSNVTEVPADPVSSPLPPKQYRAGFEYNEKTDTFYKLYTKSRGRLFRNPVMAAIKTCYKEGAKLLNITSDEDLKQVQALKNKYLDLEARVMVAPKEYKGEDMEIDEKCNVVDLNGEIDTDTDCDHRPFVCTVAAKDALAYNAECGVYSNDYESKISTTGSCYRVSTEFDTWDEAQAICQAEGAHLVILNSAKELEVVYNMLKNKSHENYEEEHYLAGVRADTSTEPRVFKTVLNQTMEEVGYGPWEEDETDNSQDNRSFQDCVILDTSRHGKYSDVTCNTSRLYVCEIAVATLGTTVTPSTPSSDIKEVDEPVSSPVPPKIYRSDYEYNVNTDAFYKLHIKGSTKLKAFKTCWDEGAELVSATSDEDLNQVQAMMKRFPNIKAPVLVLSETEMNARYADLDNFSCTVLTRNGTIGKSNTYFQELPFACKATAEDALYDEECGVYSNDYESKISTTGKCYRVSRTEATWIEAHASCQADGAQLVVLDDDKELEVLFNMLQNKPEDSETQYFAGLTADRSSGKRVFKTIYDETLEEIGYGPWEEGEPNDHIREENCVALDTRRHGKYNDVWCDVKMKYVCQSSPAEVSSNIGSNSVSSRPIKFKKYRPDYEYNINANAFYKLHTEGALKMYAAEKCREEGAELVKLKSDKDSKQVFAMMKKLPNLEDYIMVETYADWLYGSRNYRKCNVMNREGKIETTSTYQELPFVCKVAAKDVPYNEECDVYSNDYESRISTTGSCYRVSTALATWSEALASCQADGAQLVVLSSDKELEVLYNMLRDKPHNSETQYFAGVRADTTSEPRVFKTVLNQTLEEVGYGPWDEDEPNNYGGGANCVVLVTRRHGKYNDLYCNVLMPYVCESVMVVPPATSEPPNTPSSDVTVSEPVSSPLPSKQYRQDYQYNEKTIAFYKLHTDGVSKRLASKKCIEEGTELARIASDEDVRQILAMMKKVPDLKDSVMVASNVDKSRGNQSDDQCNVVNSNGEIKTTDPCDGRPFVCKVAARDAPINMECRVFSNGYESMISTTGSCYRVSTDVANSWNEAYASCQAEGAHLVILNNAEELEIIYKMLQEKPHNSETQYYAGAREVTFTEPRVFRTVLNQTLEEVGYEAWDENEPNDYEGGEHCVALDTRRHGKYNDVPCFNRMPYVCESSGLQLQNPTSSGTPDV